MKLIAGVLAIVFVFSIRADTRKPAPDERVSLDIGSITVWLGEPKAEVLKKFNDAGYQLSDSSDRVGASAGTELHNLRFRNGQLAYADLEWYRTGKIEPMEAALGALSALAEKSKPPVCILTHEPVSRPEARLDRVFVTCGSRSVMISEGTVQNHPTLTVSEQIGEIQPAAQK